MVQDVAFEDLSEALTKKELKMTVHNEWKWLKIICQI